jgi:hypothetical protein
MVDVRHWPVVGRVVAPATALLDLFLNSGEFVFAVVGFLLENFATIYTAIRALESLANRFAWLPAGVLDDIVTAALVAVFVLEVLRLSSQALEQ